MGFIGKVVVGSVGMYVINKVLERTGLGDKIIEAGVGLVDRALHEVAKAAEGVTVTPAPQNRG